MSSSWYDRIVGNPGSKADGVQREILVIEDQPEARELILTVLNKLGWTAHQAGNGAEALQVMAEHHAKIGLALVDVILPDTDGMSLAHKLRVKYPRVAIMLLSGHLNDESRWIVSSEGFRFLPKPFSIPQLRDAVAVMLGDADSTSST